jgi:hypothetical protein
MSDHMKSWWNRRGRWERWFWAFAAFHGAYAAVVFGPLSAIVTISLDVALIYAGLGLWALGKYLLERRREG